MTVTIKPKKSKGLIKLEPFGVNLWGDGYRPVLLLRCKDGKDSITMPVPLNPLEAGVTLSQSNKNNRPVTIHKATQILLNSLDLTITRCVFEEIRNGKQYVRLSIKNHPKMESIVLAAEDAMSLCLYLDVPVFASLELVHQSRTLLMELESLAANKSNNDKLRRQQTYIQ